MLALTLTNSTGLAADVPTFHLTAGGETGNGFLVKDWRGTGGYLLVTALHVVHNQTDIKARRVDCTGKASPVVLKIPPETQVLVWPRHDLAAFVLLDNTFPDQAEAGDISFGPPPPKTDLVHVHGTSQINVCQDGVGFLVGQPRSDLFFQNLQNLQAKQEMNAGKIMDGNRLMQIRKQVQGSMANDLYFLQYLSSSAPGTSGAAVTLPEEPKTVVGVHNGGYNGRDISWAISFAGLQKVLSAPEAVVILGKTAWPKEYKRALLVQAASNDSISEELDAQAHRTLRMFLVEAGCLGETGLSGALKNQDAWRCGGAFAFEFFRFPESTQRSSLAVRVGAGYRWSQVRQRVLGPDGNLLREQLVLGKGLMLEPELELRFRRNSRLQPALGMRKRFWLAHHPDISGGEENSLAASYAFAGRLYFAPLDVRPVSKGTGFLELGLAWGQEVSTTARYTGIGAELTRYGLAHSVSMFLTAGLAYGM